MKKREVLLVIASIMVTYLSIEAGWWWLEGHELEPGSVTQPYYNREAAQFDIDHVYRWKSGKTRFVYIVKGEVIWDHVFSANAEGYHSRQDFVVDKPEGTKRIVLFGDSFAAGLFLEVPLADRLQEHLDGVQVYGFAVDGGGIHNWHHIFENVVKPKYAPDAIIIASFVGDLGRDFCLHHSMDGWLKSGYFIRPPDSAEDFQEDFVHQLRQLIPVKTDAEIDDAIAAAEAERSWQAPPLRPYALLDAWAGLKVLVTGRERYQVWDYVQFSDPEPQLSEAELQKRYPKAFHKLRSMIAWGKDNGVPVLLASVPSRESAANFSILGAGVQNQHQRELISFASLYGADYLDGYEVYEDLGPDGIFDDMWLKYDAHWAQAGSDRFAEHLAAFVREHWQLSVDP